MTKIAATEALIGAETVVGVFDREADAQGAIAALERAGMPPDRIGIVVGNVRQAREVAGSYSPQGAVVGALIGLVLVVGYLIFGGDSVRPNIAGVAIAGFAIIGGLAFIGWLGGRARLFKQDEYAKAEDEIASGEVLVSVVCDTPDGADATRALLERNGAREVRVEESGESV
jgi:hypothetical protein